MRVKHIWCECILYKNIGVISVEVKLEKTFARWDRTVLLIRSDHEGKIEARLIHPTERPP